MDDWNGTPWFYQDWVPVAGGVILGLAVIAAVIWFIDGIRQYGCWLHKEEGDEK